MLFATCQHGSSRNGLPFVLLKARFAGSSARYSFLSDLLGSATSHPLVSCKQVQHARGAMPLNSLRSRVKDRLHHRNKAAWAQGQDNEVDDDASTMSDDSLTLTAVSGPRSLRVVVQIGCSHSQLVSCLSVTQIGSDSESTASMADVAALAAENGMDDLAGESDAASFRYIRLVIYSARAVLPKDYSGFSDP